MSIQKRDQNFWLRKIEKQYSDFYNNTPIAYFTVNSADAKILNCNKEARKLVDYSKKALLQMKIFELFADTPHGLIKAQKAFKDIQADKTNRKVELQIRMRSGRPLWVRLSVFPESYRKDENKVNV